MKLLNISLQNFRQYHGKQRLEFARDGQRNVTLIHGINGAGKTSFFLAINWCLYGRAVDDVKVIDNVGELMSKEAVQQAEPGQTIITTVELAFLHDGDRYSIRRSLSGTKQTTGLVKVGESDDFVVMLTNPLGHAVKVPNPIGVVNSILPANVREYFLFDGEKIDNFAKPEAAAQVKQAIYLVLNIETLERAQRHLDSLAAEYRKQLKSSASGELRELLGQEEKVRELLAKAEQRKEESIQERESAKRKVAEIDQRLRAVQNASFLQKRRDQLEQDISQRRTELDETIQRLATISTGSHAIVAMPVVQRALIKLNEKRERGEIPSGIRQQFLQDLLDRMICICGRPFSEHGAEHERLVSLITSRLPNSIEDDILNTSAQLTTLMSGIPDKRADIETQMRRRAQIIQTIETLDAELDDVSRQLQGSPLEEISRLEEQRREFQRDIDSRNTEDGSLSNQIEVHNKEIKKLEKAISQANKQQEQHKLQALKLELAQQSADAISEIHHAFADDMRGKIEAKTKEIFKQLVWKESHFQNVQLSPDFHLEVIDRYGLPSRSELSAGERQVLSLSFITAMAQVSEEEAPLVMDTPFGRLSSHHRNSITECLPKLTKQLILFVTDEELREQALENLLPYLGKEYRLNFDRSTSCTTIEEERNGRN